MQITREIDYSLRIMHILAESETKKNASYISDNIYVPLRFTLKILNKLNTAGLVKSYKGMDGGYALAKASSDITLLDIVEAVDGPIVINTCLNENCECTRADMSKGSCFYYHVFDDINACIAAKLKAITLDMAVEK